MPQTEYAPIILTRGQNDYLSRHGMWVWCPYLEMTVRAFPMAGECEYCHEQLHERAVEPPHPRIITDRGNNVVTVKYEDCEVSYRT